MIGLDTNVLVRFLTQDDPSQGAAATALVGALRPDDPGFVPREVVVELVWVLERAYGFDRATIADALNRLLETAELRLEEPDRVARAAARYRQGGAGFSDQMILMACEAAGCEATATFDRRAAAAPGGRLIATA